MNAFFLLEIMGWTFSGFLVHMALKIINAVRFKDDFSIWVFLEKNFTQYASSFVFLLVGCFFVWRGDLPQFEPYVLFLIGMNGGSTFKNLLKRKEK